MIDENPDLLGPVVDTAPRHFEQLVVAALSAEAGGARPAAIAQTLISASVGVKHQVETRAEFVQRLTVAVDLLRP